MSSGMLRKILWKAQPEASNGGNPRLPWGQGSDGTFSIHEGAPDKWLGNQDHAGPVAPIELQFFRGCDRMLRETGQ
ncbi:MAG: hypothetical protein EOR16_30920 [Mesorhizobium sp.]|uniref:hypothetical protein n=1 Tax=Mesorhizobium sp. TaxID=1871066 RepID=UPI000FE8BA5D|nr:hypothetical protein [Mesorhizobium sp.]RWI50297.1 MAG: hypothetical protein EOR16_30920 [Mesorhizobium sp.]